MNKIRWLLLFFVLKKVVFILFLITVLGVSGIWVVRVNQAETALRERFTQWNQDPAFPFSVEFQDITSGGFPFYYTLHIHEPQIFWKEGRQLFFGVEGTLKMSSRLMSHAVVFSTAADVKGERYLFRGDKKVVAYLEHAPWSIQGYLKEFTSLDLLNPSMQDLLGPFSVMHHLREVSLTTGSGLLTVQVEGKESDLCLQPAKIRVGIEEWETTKKEGWLKVEHIGVSRECHPPLPLVQEKMDGQELALFLVHPPLLDLGLSKLRLQGVWSFQKQEEEKLYTFLLQNMQLETPLQKQRLAGSVEWHEEPKQTIGHVSVVGGGEFLKTYTRFITNVWDYLKRNPHLLEAKTEQEKEWKQLFIDKPTLFKEAVPPLHELGPYQTHLALRFERIDQKWNMRLEDFSFRFKPVELTLTGTIAGEGKRWDGNFKAEIDEKGVLQLFAKPLKKWLEIEHLTHSSFLQGKIDEWKEKETIEIPLHMMGGQS